MIPKVLWKNRWAASAMALMGVAVMAFAVSFNIEKSEPHHHHIPITPVGAAEDIEDLVEKADVIVVGTVGTSVTEHTIGPYSGGYDGAPTFPVTDYQVTVTSVLKGDGSVSSGNTLTLREYGHLSVANTGAHTHDKFPMSNAGDSRLFVLGKNPDDVTYGLYFGPYSRFSVDGNAVKYPGLDDESVQFAKNVSPADFMASIQEEVNR